jgi:hypothetical protein
MSGYISEARLATLRAGSLEERQAAVAAAVQARNAGASVVATQADRVVFLDARGDLAEAVIYDGADGITVGEAAPVPGVIGDDEVPRHVAGVVRGIVRDVCEGTATDLRTRVRDLALLADAVDGGLLAEALVTMGQAARGIGRRWSRWYEAHEAEIRRRQWGSVRELEATVPPALGEASADRARDGVRAVAAAAQGIVDAVRSLRFDRGDPLGAIRESLIGEASTMAGALLSAGGLMLVEDVRDVQRVAQAHDACVRRVRNMAVVAGYLTRRTSRTEE